MTQVQIDIEKLSAALNLLSEHPNVIIKNEPHNSQIKQAYQLAVLGYTILRETNYDVMHDMLEKLPRPTHIRPESVGSFLFGDHRVCYGDVIKRCSPLALNSIPRQKRKNFFRKDSTCPDQIWLLKTDHEDNKYYASIVSSHSNKALIFVDIDDTDHFKGFTHDEVQLFVDNGVTEVEVFTAGNPTHSTILPKTSITEVPICNTNTPSNISIDVSETTNDDGTNWAWIWAIVIIVIAVVIVCCLWYLTSRSMYSNSFGNATNNDYF